jgi:16S rRNA (uracil1498-N3)-methyltransferase
MTEELKEPGGRVRLFVEGALGAGVEVSPGEGPAHYLLHVMRAKPGDRLRLFNGRDGEWTAEIAELKKNRVRLTALKQIVPQTASPDVWLVFAPIKKTPADYVVQKATELGVSVLQPVMTRRTIVSRVNLERMRANAVEAAEQSERLDVPEIREAVPLEKLIASWPQERRLIFCDEGGDAQPLARALTNDTAKSYAILSGPEGGFDPAERDMLRAQSFVVPVTLGPRILRADTAALAALAVWGSVKG